MILIFLFIAQNIVCANLCTYALTNSNFTQLVVAKCQWAVMQCKITEWKVSASIWSFVRNESGVPFKCKLRISYHRMKQVLNKFRIKWCMSSYFSLPAKLLLIQSGIFTPIRAPPERFDNIVNIWIKIHCSNKNIISAKTRSLWEWIFVLFLLLKRCAVNCRTRLSATR